MATALSGIIERVVFHNPETGYAVLRVQAGRRHGLATVVGTIPAVYSGEFVEADGDWVQDRDHGLQFKATSLRITPPHTPEGIVKFLASGLVKGIGPHYARKIVDVFGERTLQVIDESPAFLSEVKGIGARRIEQIRASWKAQRAVRDIIVFLHSHGVGTARAVRIYKTYGDKAIELVRENPYRLATDVWGIAFRTADELAGRLGIERTSPLRARAAVRYVLKELSDEGHVGYPESGVVERTAEVLQVDRSIVVAAIEAERESGDVVREPGGTQDLSPPTPLPEAGRRETVPAPPSRFGKGAGGLGSFSLAEPWLYLKPLFKAEVGVAQALRMLGRGPHPLPAIKTDAALAWVEQRMGIELAPAQRDAIQRSTSDKVLVITGGPGVGKTTIVRGIIEVFAAKRMRVALCAPTGRAAKRLAESTGREAKTIHRLLEFEPSAGGFQRNRDHPLDYDLIVVDETSMVDISLMHALLKAVSPWSCLVFVGDVDQLPSVGPGAVLADIIASRAVPVVRLTEIFRQAEKSWIVRAAHAVNRGAIPQSSPQADGDFFLIEMPEPGAIVDRIVQMVRQRIPERLGLDPMQDIQVLSPMHNSELGVRNLNMVLQAALNPPAGQAELHRYGTTFRVGDRVLQTQNNYQREVFNGDLGRISRINDADQEVLVDIDGRAVSYDFSDLDELTLAYACTIHKSQGSEYPAVILPVHTQHFVMLQRNLFYTAITRGKRLVIVIGNRRGIEKAVSSSDRHRRLSLLRERLQAADSS